MYHGLAVTLGLIIARDTVQGLNSRSNGCGRSRRLRYCRTIWWQWTCVTMLVLAIPLVDLVWLAQSTAPDWVAFPALSFIVVSNILVTMYIPIVLAWSSVSIRKRLLAPWRAMHGLLPTTASERGLWIVLSLTTGICEELLFRGFAVYYLMHQPWSLSLPSSTLIACFLFALGHTYQGLRGVVQTLLLATALSALVLVTGNLILPMIVHTLINLRVALLPSSESLRSLSPHPGRS